MAKKKIFSITFTSLLALIINLFSSTFSICSQQIDSPVEPTPLFDKVCYSKNTILVDINKTFAKEYLRTNQFFAEYDEDTVDLSQLDSTALTIPVIMALMPIILVSNKAWLVESIDEDLYNCFNRVKKVFKIFHPSLSWEGEIIPEKLVKNVPLKTDDKSSNLALLFSGGLDAVCSSICHINSKQLLITICGSDIHVKNKHMWNCVKKHVNNYADLYGQSNSFVRSNFALLHAPRLSKLTPAIKNWWGCTSQSLGYTGLTAPICLCSGNNTLLIASTRTEECPYPYGTHPVIDNALSFAGITVIHDGAEYDRVEKIDAIIKQCNAESLPLPPLRVCWGHDKEGGNCGNCEKCLRTINELLAAGIDPNEVGFDIVISKIMDLTRNYLGKGHTFKRGLAWHWGCIQRYISKHLNSYDNIKKDYFQWLANVPIKANSTITYSADQKKYFTELWKSSLAGCLDYSSLTDDSCSDTSPTSDVDTVQHEFILPG